MKSLATPSAAERPSAANMDKRLLSPPDSDLRFKIATLNLHVRLPEKVFTNRVAARPRSINHIYAQQSGDAVGVSINGTIGQHTQPS